MGNELFIKLLSQNNRLVIPDFGAFLRKELDESQVIIFTPFLKKDDGALRNAVADHFQIDQQEANDIVTEFVNEVRNKLSTNGLYYVEDLGTLKLDANGAISFLYDMKPKEPAIISPINNTNQIEEEPNPTAYEETQPTYRPRVVADQSPMHSMIEEETTNNYSSRPLPPSYSSEPQPIRPRPTGGQGGYIPRPVGQRPAPQPAQRTQQSRPMGNPAQQNPEQTHQQRPMRARPLPPKKQPKSKMDVWLIGAIVVAILVIALMIYGYFSTSEPEIILDQPTIENSTTQTTE